MRYYEEEGEIIPDCVINYQTVDENNQPVPFSVLPLLWSEDETPAPGNSDTQILLCGTAVTGPKMYEKVIAWRPEISYALPMIYVLSKENKVWMQLRKPRRSFEDCIMSTLLLPTLLLEIKLNFEVGSQVDYEEDDSDNDDATFDSVCVLCDNGGVLLCCEDKCLRSFHPNINVGVESSCESLGYSDSQVDVFQCANADCGHFYHPNCVAELLQPCDTFKRSELQQKIHSGESFVCPAHKCNICVKGEEKTVHELQFAMCRRCPKAYHRKCLPSEITFQSDGIIDQRAWDGLLSNRVLIYCMDHEILSEIGTPKRDHIIFPNVEGKMQTTSGLLSSKEKMIKSKDMGTLTMTSPLKRSLKHAGIYCGHSTSATFTGEKVFRHANIDKSKLSVPQKTMHMPNSDKGKISDGYKNRIADKFMKVESRGQPPVDIELKLRMLKLIEDSTSSFNKEEFLKGKKTSSLYSSHARIAEDKTFTEGKVKGYVKAVQTALKILNDGGKLEDAKAVCEPQVLKQLVRWKKQLDVYLAPVLHGNRYTSYGRHFTKVDKLELIVDKLKWYVQDGDTIVDFCCGSNDFSCLMRERLHKMGKICSFRNFDLFTPKNDFNFEQKDWMTVTLEELPAGSNLIMGLNPPFGVNGNLANKFIDKALTFKPKLIILIVPSLTERLDRKRKLPYDIIWEDQCLLSGKAFYLPGSVDVNDKQLEQHNRLAPPLYLWSRPDWTAKHKQIAETHGHFTVTRDSLQMGKMDTGENHDGMYQDMEVDSPVYLPCNNADQKSSFDWSLMGSYPSHYPTGMQHRAVSSDAMWDVYHKVLPQHSDVPGAMQGIIHEVPPLHPSVGYNSVDGVHHGAFPPPCQYPTEPYYYPGWPGF
uniref:PHD-type domain-containing protein n=1 Tax=Daucus carota subsp. sativus TaxID=79200 RepID=A0A162A7A8_DAUCS